MFYAFLCISDDGNLVIYTLRIQDVSPEFDNGLYACSDVRESVRATQIVKLNYIGEHFEPLMAFKFQKMFALLLGNGSERRLRTTIALPTAFLATFYLYVIVIKQISRWKI